jgi:acyl phosphate:glycerol-3-phosphate acyltransferase
MTLLVALIFGYFLGSIPFGVLLTKITGAGDLRTMGSGNIGATNVLRTGRKGLAAATLLGDMLKGSVAVWISWRSGIDAAMVAGTGAFLGHLFPVWLRFKGGKGVATFLGCFLGLKPLAALVFVVLWVGTAAISRYSSLSALIASAAVAPVLLYLKEPAMAVMALALTAILWWKHKENIRRLLSGTEGRIGQKS